MASEREAAIKLVAEIIGRWESARVYGPAALGVRRHVVELKRELGQMQAAGEPGASLARRWCLLYGIAAAA